MRKYLLPFLVAGLVASMFTVALAKDAGRRQMPARAHGGAITVYYGVITALGPESLTIKPEVPKREARRLARYGGTAPQLPSSVTVQLRKSTRWYFKDAEGSAKNFAIGDTVRLKLRRKPGANQNPVALVVSDPQTAFRFVTGSANAASARRRERRDLLKGTASAAPRRDRKAASAAKKSSSTRNQAGAQKPQLRSTGYQRNSSAGLLILARKNRNKQDQSGIYGANNSNQSSDSTRKHKSHHKLFKTHHKKHHTATTTG